MSKYHDLTKVNRCKKHGTPMRRIARNRWECSLCIRDRAVHKAHHRQANLARVIPRTRELRRHETPGPLDVAEW